MGDDNKGEPWFALVEAGMEFCPYCGRLVDDHPRSGVQIDRGDGVIDVVTCEKAPHDGQVPPQRKE